MQILQSVICPITPYGSFKEDKDIIYYWFEVYDDITNRWWHQTPFAYSCVQIYKDDDRPYFGPTHVYTGYRGKGIQKKLIEFRIDYCRQKGYTEVVTKADNYKQYSIRNILACGFVEYFRQDNEIFFRRKI